MAKWVLGVGLGLMLAVGLGCDGNTNPPPKYNAVLSDAAGGAPIVGDAPDLGILADPGAYSGQAATVGAGVAATAEENAQQLMEKAITALLERDMLSLLDTIAVERLGPLNDDEVKNALVDTFVKLDAVLAAFNQRLQEPELAELRGRVNQITALLTTSELVGLFRFESLDGENVNVTLDPAQASAFAERLAAAVGEQAPIPPDVSADVSAGADEAPPLIVSQVNGEWRFMPPAPPPDANPADIVQGLGVANQVLDGLLMQLNTVDAAVLADTNQWGEIFGPAIMPVMMQMMMQGGMGQGGMMPPGEMMPPDGFGDPNMSTQGGPPPGFFESFEDDGDDMDDDGDDDMGADENDEPQYGDSQARFRRFGPGAVREDLDTDDRDQRMDDQLEDDE